jgi:hypothetical protein
MALRVMTIRVDRMGIAQRKTRQGGVVCILSRRSVSNLRINNGHKTALSLWSSAKLDNFMESEELEQDGFVERTFETIRLLRTR